MERLRRGGIIGTGPQAVNKPSPVGLGPVHDPLDEELDRLAVHPLILTFGMLFILQGLIFTYTDRSVGRAKGPSQ